jgi:hypothetical protein
LPPAETLIFAPKKSLVMSRKGTLVSIAGSARRAIASS